MTRQCAWEKSKLSYHRQQNLLKKCNQKNHGLHHNHRKCKSMRFSEKIVLHLCSFSLILYLLYLINRCLKYKLFQTENKVLFVLRLGRTTQINLCNFLPSIHGYLIQTWRLQSNLNRDSNFSDASTFLFLFISWGKIRFRLEQIFI